MRLKHSILFTSMRKTNTGVVAMRNFFWLGRHKNSHICYILNYLIKSNLVKEAVVSNIFCKHFNTIPQGFTPLLITFLVLFFILDSTHTQKKYDFYHNNIFCQYNCMHDSPVMTIQKWQKSVRNSVKVSLFNCAISLHNIYAMSTIYLS